MPGFRNFVSNKRGSESKLKTTVAGDGMGFRELCSTGILTLVKKQKYTTMKKGIETRSGQLHMLYTFSVAPSKIEFTLEHFDNEWTVVQGRVAIKGKDELQSTNNPCFSGSALVYTWSAVGKKKQKQCQDLRRGDLLRLPGEPFDENKVGKVKFLTITNTIDAPMIQFKAQEGSGITLWHPIEVNNTWQFPEDLYKNTRDTQTSAIFNGKITENKLCNMMLYDDKDRQHARVYVGGVIACTLGHGLTKNKNGDESKVISHEFFGNYDTVSKSFSGHDADDGLVKIAGSHYSDPDAVDKKKDSFTFDDASLF